jgi:hypothetical protein
LVIYEVAIKAGAYPQVQFLSESLRSLVLRYGSAAQLNWVPETHGMRNEMQ